MPANTVKVDRSTKWGNPYKVSASRTLGKSRRLFLRALLREKLNFNFQDIKMELAGKNIACWCKIGEPCHGDLLLNIAALPDRRAFVNFSNSFLIAADRLVSRS